MRHVYSTGPVRTSALLLALFMAVLAFQLNASMLSPALPTMQRALNATASEIGLTQTAFFTAATLSSLVMPRWGDLIGRRRILLGSLAATAIGCVIAAMSTNVGTLFLGRLAQGAAGPIVPTALIMLRQQLTNEKRYATWMAVLTSINGGIAGVDALLGGWLASHWGYHSIFWTMAGVCVLALIAVTAGTIGHAPTTSAAMDWKGAFLLAISLGTTLVAANEAGNLGAANWVLVVFLLVAGGGAFLLFWRAEKNTAHPLVSTVYLKQRRTWALLLTNVLTMTGVFAIMNGVVPNMAQDRQVTGIAADLVSWYTLTPYALAGLLMGLFAGRLAARFGYRAVLRVGLLISAGTLAVTALSTQHITPWGLLLVSALVGIAYAGLSNIMLNGLGVVLSPADNQGYLPGMNSSAFNLGSGLSYAVVFAMTTLFSSVEDATAGYRAGMLTGLSVLLLAFLTSFLIPRPEPAESPTSPVSPVSTTEKS